MKIGGLLPILQVIFIVLKLAGVTKIALWSWWLVLSPLWVGLITVALLLVIGAAVVLNGKRK